MAHIQERKLKNGESRYRVQVRLRGTPPVSATFARLTDAKRWIQQTESQIREGRYFRNSEARKHTLGEAIDRYIEDIQRRKPKSMAHQIQQLNWWKDQLGPHRLCDVTPSVIVEQRDALANGITVRKTMRSPACVNRYLAVLSRLFTIAMREWQWIEDSPMRMVSKLPEPQGRVRFLDDDERKNLLKACQESGDKFLYPVVVLAISTGMRKGEIMSLRWQDVDLTRNKITINQSKNNDRRAVPLSGLSLSLLQEHGRIRRLDTDLVFPGQTKNGEPKPADLRLPWDTAIEKAEIEDFRFHDLRHTAASYLLMSGATVSELAEILGHRTLQMVKRYSHISDSHSAKVVGKMNEAIFGTSEENLDVSN